MRPMGLVGMHEGGGKNRAGSAHRLIENMEPEKSKPRKSVRDTITTLPQIWELLRPRRGLLAAGFVLMAINRVSGLVLPASTQFLIDDIIGQRNAPLPLPPGGA